MHSTETTCTSGTPATNTTPTMAQANLKQLTVWIIQMFEDIVRQVE
jgi:hypothetical protein